MNRYIFFVEDLNFLALNKVHDLFSVSSWRLRTKWCDDTHSSVSIYPRFPSQCHSRTFVNGLTMPIPTPMSTRLLFPRKRQHRKCPLPKDPNSTRSSQRAGKHQFNSQSGRRMFVLNFESLISYYLNARPLPKASKDKQSSTYVP